MLVLLALLGLLALSTRASTDGGVGPVVAIDGRGPDQVICARWAKMFGAKPEFKDMTFICLSLDTDRPQTRSH